MKNLYSIVTGLVLCFLAEEATAGILIESTDNEGNHVSIRIGNGMARIESGDLQGYMLMNMSKERIYVVSTEEHAVVDLSLSPDNGASPHGSRTGKLDRQHAVFIDQGEGPKIAGYATMHYRVMMGDTHCFDEYLSRGAVDNPEIHRFIEIMAKQSQAEENEGMTEYFASDNPCEAEEEVMDGQYLSLGIPLRTLDNHGVAVHEVTHIQDDATFPDGTFEFPEGYPVMTRAEIMQRAMERMESQGAGTVHGNPHGHMDNMTPEFNGKE